MSKHKAIWVAWISLHLILATAIVAIFVDQMDLMNQVTVPAACDAYLKIRPSAAVDSDLAFALHCWDAGNFAQFLAVATLIVTVTLLPVTFGLVAAIRKANNAQ